MNYALKKLIPDTTSPALPFKNCNNKTILAMKHKKIKSTGKEELKAILERIYRSLKIQPVPKKRLRPIPVETDWNWHYNY